MHGATIDWEKALAQHGRWLRTVVLARLGEPQAADEVMQEVALAAVRQSAPIADPQKVAPWLYRLAVRQALLYRRKMGRTRRLAERFAQRVPREATRAADDPLVWLLADEERAMVRSALGRLARRDAEILLLKYSEGWSYHEIASRLGIGHSAVEARLHRARKRLREELVATSVIEATA